MQNELLGLFSPIMNSFQRARTIRRIEDGCIVSNAEARDLKGLHERTLKDIGYYVS